MAVLGHIMACWLDPNFKTLCMCFITTKTKILMQIKIFLKRNGGQNLRINKLTNFMMKADNELPLFERPAAATGVDVDDDNDRAFARRRHATDAWDGRPVSACWLLYLLSSLTTVCNNGGGEAGVSDADCVCSLWAAALYFGKVRNIPASLTQRQTVLKTQTMCLNYSKVDNTLQPHFHQNEPPSVLNK